MKKKSMILFFYLFGSSCIGMGQNTESIKIHELDELEAMGGNSGGGHLPQLSFNFSFWERLQNAVGAISGLYLFNKLSSLIREHPLTSMLVAIFIGIITDENKENIIAGIRKLRNSVSRVMGFNRKQAEKDKKNKKKSRINFLNCADLDFAVKAPKMDKNFVFNI